MNTPQIHIDQILNVVLYMGLMISILAIMIMAVRSIARPAGAPAPSKAAMFGPALSLAFFLIASISHLALFIEIGVLVGVSFLVLLVHLMNMVFGRRQA